MNNLEQPTETETEPGTSLMTEQETEDKDETISSTSTQDFDREKVERECINLALHYQQIGESYETSGGRSATYEQMPVSHSSFRNAYIAHGQSNNRRKGVIYVQTAIQY